MSVVARYYTIQISGDVAGVITLPRQMKFSSGRAINDTLPIAQDNAIGDLDEEYVLRGTWYKPRTKYGINTRNASFRSDQPEGYVFTRADWLLEHEGANRGVKTPESGEHLADPEDPVTRGNIRRKFPIAQKAGRLLLNAQGPGSLLGGKRRRFGRNAGHFKIKSKKTGNELIFQRVRKGSDGEIRRNKRGIPIRGRVTGSGGTTLVLKHVLKKSVKVERKLVFQRSVENTVRVHYAVRYNSALRGALRGAKIR